MLSESKIRILPVLIIVAMMAFSVRLVDFATGVSSFSGAAQAESPAKKSPSKAKAMSADAEDNNGAMPDDDALEPMDTMADEVLDDDEDKWRDPGNDEYEFSTVKKEVFQELKTRRIDLEQQERELMTREAILRAAEQELGRKYEELSNLRSEIEGLLGKQSEEELGRIRSLVKIYEGMKPKEAARIFDTLDLEVLISVVANMSERRLSPILANMNPERARTVTIMLAEEKRLPALPPSN